MTKYKIRIKEKENLLLMGLSSPYNSLYFDVKNLNEFVLYKRLKKVENALKELGFNVNITYEKEIK